jgi:arsenate reductase (thioredoxin)
MAEAFLREMRGNRFEPFSAGADAQKALDRDAVSAMLEIGIDVSGQQPKRVDALMRERVSCFETLCDRDSERACPIFPSAIWQLKWPILNQAAANGRDEHRAPVRRARDEIRKGVIQFVQEHS